MRITGSRIVRGTFIAIAVVGATGSAAIEADAATLHVAANGIDSVTCGGFATPCRSLSRAIVNASAGDRIIVGPGRYGDLDRDGVFNEAGEEAGPGVLGSPAIILVDKRLTIESRDGAGATILDGSGSMFSVVVILADDTVFGKPSKGFTLTGAGQAGLRVAAEGVTVAGNVAVANGGSGFSLAGNDHEFHDNKAIANGGSGATFAGFPFTVGVRVNVRSNLSAHNGEQGFHFARITGVDVRRNVVLGNRLSGIEADDETDLALVQNSFVANGRFGAHLEGQATIDRTNVYGNLGDATFPNCGLRHLGAGLITNVFFGAATGPGPDPADADCGTVAVTSFATAEINVPDILR
jgi:hypothetical protein